MTFNIDFYNYFCKIVYKNVLSFESKKQLNNILTDKVNKPYFLATTEKSFTVKKKPQQVNIFVRFKNGKHQIVGFQFGRTDFLTGEKKEHFQTIYNILKEKTPEELEKFY